MANSAVGEGVALAVGDFDDARLFGDVETGVAWTFVRENAAIAGTVGIVYGSLKYLLKRAAVFGHKHFARSEDSLDGTKGQMVRLNVACQNVE